MKNSDSIISKKIKNKFKIDNYSILFLNNLDDGMMSWKNAYEIETRLIQYYRKKENIFVLNKMKTKKKLIYIKEVENILQNSKYSDLVIAIS